MRSVGAQNDIDPVDRLFHWGEGEQVKVPVELMPSLFARQGSRGTGGINALTD